MLISQFIIVTLSALLHGGWNFYAKKAPQKLEIITLAVGFASLVFFPLLFSESSNTSTFGMFLAVVTGSTGTIGCLCIYLRICFLERKDDLLENRYDSSHYFRSDDFKI